MKKFVEPKWQQKSDNSIQETKILLMFIFVIFSALITTTNQLLCNNESNHYQIVILFPKTQQVTLKLLSQSRLTRSLWKCFSMEQNSRLEKIQRKLKPQQAAIAGGSLLMLSSGMHTGYGFYHWKDADFAWTRSVSHTLIALAVVAFWIGCIVGSTLALLVMKFFNKKMIYVSQRINCVDKLIENYEF